MTEENTTKIGIKVSYSVKLENIPDRISDRAKAVIKAYIDDALNATKALENPVAAKHMTVYNDSAVVNSWDFLDLRPEPDPQEVLPGINESAKGGKGGK